MGGHSYMTILNGHGRGGGSSSSSGISALFLKQLGIFGGSWGIFGIYIGSEVIGRSGWRNYGRNEVKDLFNLELDNCVWARDTGKVIISFCLESF